MNFQFFVRSKIYLILCLQSEMRLYFMRQTLDVVSDILFVKFHMS